MSETIETRLEGLGSYNDYLESKNVDHSQESITQYTRELQARVVAAAAIKGVEVDQLHNMHV
ncbi:MAG: hypothetical protein WCP03_04855 [Candidatus Saccharibacteria bacterium]